LVRHDLPCRGYGAEIAVRNDRFERSVRMILSLAFLDPALIDAACVGTLPRGYAARASWISRRDLAINGEP
jgi:hypothetical protein